MIPPICDPTHPMHWMVSGSFMVSKSLQKAMIPGSTRGSFSRGVAGALECALLRPSDGPLPPTTRGHDTRLHLGVQRVAPSGIEVF